ncbi:hypothetical protein PAXRUDRAFT_708495 [Paxillus rubicundulus Ve08.2h10]|uniref:Uncharacterized protein n=1 Tax=Paxillus rubicundulus Ve08.2h10 TaxID=930991 RepID=A0A0D0DS45_9AGAM|nr:hypothetical protein PAXRUDRAFT_708495 [Paxillus rubicundulus Ve08.2h10]
MHVTSWGENTCNNHVYDDTMEPVVVLVVRVPTHHNKGQDRITPSRAPAIGSDQIQTQCEGSAGRVMVMRSGYIELQRDGAVER